MMIWTLLLCPTVFVLAQNSNSEPLMDKNGQVVLPQKGDIGLGINTIPFFYWLGNSFNATTNNTYATNNKLFQIFGNSIILGKYMLSDKTALRLAWGINFGHTEDEKYVQDDAANNPAQMVKDRRSLDWSRASLAVGYESRRGKGRLQGFWGGDIRITYNQEDDYRYYYGNGYGLTNLVPTSYDWGNNLNGNRRKIMDTGTNVLGVGLRAFVGAEYFIAPKVCIGAEFGWGPMYRHTLAVTVAEEYYDAIQQQVIEEEVYTAATNAFSAGVDNMDGSIYLMFFFNSKGKGTTPKTSKKKKEKTKKEIKPVMGNNRF